MSIIRSPRPESNYYILSKEISEDARLSWAARGLLVYLLGKPDHWQVNVESLRKQTDGARIRTGRDGLYALLAELELVGYLQRSRQRCEGGRLSEVDYTVSEVPRSSPHPANPDVESAPHPAQPDTAQPDTANPTLVSNDLKQELREANNPQPPKGGEGDLQFAEDDADLLGGKAAPAAKKPRGQADETPAFVRFYTQAYPKREKRADAARAWRLKGCEAIADKIIAEVTKRAANDPQWRKDGGQYIPLPASYLNGRRWEDEWKGKASGGGGADDGVPSWMEGAI